MNINYKMILKVISVALFTEGIVMLIPSLVGYSLGERTAAFSMLLCGLIFSLLGGILFNHFKKYMLKITNRDSILIIALAWITVSLLGSIPFMLSGFNPIESIFESVAGWTTTGAWVIGPNKMGKTLLLWKALESFMGGFSILLLALPLLPALNIKAQKSGASKLQNTASRQIHARNIDKAKFICIIYFVMAIIEFLLLLPSKLPALELFINTLFTISTAGIVNFTSSQVLSLTPYVRLIFTIFTFLSSCNFILFFLIAIKEYKKAFNGIEFKTHVCLIGASFLIITSMLMLSGGYNSLSSAAADSIVQTVSFSSTSGFNVCNVSSWPTTCKMILICLGIIGGCLTSTGGSIKVMRFVIFFKLIIRGIHKRIHTNAVEPIILNGKALSAKDASETTGFILIYFILLVFSAIVFSIDAPDLETALSAAFGTFTNTGTCFGLLECGDYSIFSKLSQVFASIAMLCGRLEIMPIIILFLPSLWKSDKKF